jgi:hypothetical protein
MAIDQIVGIAVLDQSVEPQELHVLCECGAGDGKRRHTSIPVYQEGTPEPKPFGWKYKIEPGNVLKVTPSLRWTGGEGKPDVFHNGGEWRIVYEEFKGPGDHWKKATDLFATVNGIKNRA